MLRAALQKADELAVLELLAADASAISEVTLPLHTACRKKALCTGRLIAALLKVRPDGAQQLDGEGLLPLHIAARSCAPVDVLELLIQAYPDGMRAMDATSYRLPLHFACIRKANLDCIRVLLAANPVAASYEDGDAHTPAQLADLWRSLGRSAAAATVYACSQRRTWFDQGARRQTFTTITFRL